MNKHILMVMKWLNDSESVSQEELLANRESAYSESAAYWAADDAAYWAATRAATCAAAAYWAATCAAAASHWIDEYFKSTGEDKKTYIDTLGE
jgi:hypothetical protein